jgi:NTE family protein
VSLPEDLLARAASPVGADEDDATERGPEPGIALCLSGGGYRAMLFHLGALWRLNELGYLPRLDRVSSVSGGSITAGVLALRWQSLAFDGGGVSQAFEAEVVAPLRKLAGKTIDFPAIALGALGPGTVGNRVAGAYRRHVFGDATLQDLPDRPRFVINATSLQTGSLWRFSKAYMRDYKVGEVKDPTTELAVAVAASSAFPPLLSPVVLTLDAGDYSPPSGEPLHQPPFTTKPALTDGGVYDNLGLETVWKRYETVLISDGGGRMGPLAKPRRLWPLQSFRVLSVIDTQVRNLRKRQAIDSYKAGLRKGVYWGIRTHIADYGLTQTLDCPFDKTSAIARVATRLGKMDAATQERLINWGYAVCDAGMRAHVDTSLPPAAQFPYPQTGVG